MSDGPLPGLEGLRVLDLSDDIAGAYCAKLLGDAGARVTKVERPDGHSLRRWSDSGSAGRDGESDSALFRFLAASHDAVVLEPASPGAAPALGRLLDGADVAITSSLWGEPITAGWLDPAELRAEHRDLVVVSLSSFGLRGPRGGERAPEFLLQALGGSLHNHGTAERSPLAVGGHLAEWTAGLYGALGALTALTQRRRQGQGDLVDVSALECLAVTFICYPSVAASMPGGVKRRSTYVMVPGIEPCADGYVGLATITTAQWHTFLDMMGRPDLAEDASLNNQQDRRRPDVTAAIEEWARQRTASEIVELGALYRIPTVPIGNGRIFPQIEHVVARQLYDANPRGGLPHPRPPFRSSRTERRAPGVAPTMAERREATRSAGEAEHKDAGRPFVRSDGRPEEGRLPLEGVRIVDFTAFLAGPMATQYLACMGADVVKVESVQRPDPIRFTTMVQPTVDQWWEQGSIFHSVNLNKRGLTLNLADPRGQELIRGLVATADVVVENFTPRVMEQFGLGYDDLCALKPDLIMVRMPGFGLDGPWRDRPGFAASMEQCSGLAWGTGYEDGLPQIPGSCDPLAGMHSAFAILTALEHRTRTGQGQQIELAMIDMAANLVVEQALEYAAYGEMVTRIGNRNAAVPHQAVYDCAEEQQWVALAVTTQEQWATLGAAIGQPAGWPEQLSEVARPPGRSDPTPGEEQAERLLAAWFTGHGQKDAVAALRAAGVPVEPVVHAYDVDHDEQMGSRAFWEEVTHPVVGTHRFPGWPIRFSWRTVPWFHRPAPMLGQHNQELLAEMGIGPDQLSALGSDQVVGTRPLGL